MASAAMPDLALVGCSRLGGDRARAGTSTSPLDARSDVFFFGQPKMVATSIGRNLTTGILSPYLLRSRSKPHAVFTIAKS